MGIKHYWRDLWRYRELFFFLAWRDILVRYKQTSIGIAWSVLRPLLTMIAFTLVFSKLAKLPSEGVPYPILVFAALLPWQFFSNSLSEASNSLIVNSNLLTKVYFPRLIVPTSSIIVSLVDFLHLSRHSCPAYALVRICPGLAYLGAAPFLLASFSCILRLQSLALCSERQVSGLPLCGAVYRPVWSLYLAGGIQ